MISVAPMDCMRLMRASCRCPSSKCHRHVIKRRTPLSRGAAASANVTRRQQKSASDFGSSHNTRSNGKEEIAKQADQHDYRGSNDDAGTNEELAQAPWQPPSGVGSIGRNRVHVGCRAPGGGVVIRCAGAPYGGTPFPSADDTRSPKQYVGYFTYFSDLYSIGLLTASC